MRTPGRTARAGTRPDYERTGRDVDGYDTAACTLPIVRALRRPLQGALGRPDLAIWNDFVCPGPGAAEYLLRKAAPAVALVVASE